MQPRVAYKKWTTLQPLFGRAFLISSSLASIFPRDYAGNQPLASNHPVSGGFIQLFPASSRCLPPLKFRSQAEMVGAGSDA
jgi:hypothetical protein